MKTTAAVLFLSILVIGPRLLEAQTLDELQHPLLPKGKAAVSADYDAYAVEYFAVSLGQGEMSFYQPHYVLLPAIAFGLGRNLQLKVGGTYEFPTPFSYPMFETWDYTREKTAVKTLSGELLFRPRPNLELGATYLFGRSTWTSNYARSQAANALAIEHFRSSIVSIHGTWLSSARTVVTRTLQADLAGLHHPLLERHRWRIDGELMGRWYGHDFHDSDDVSPEFVADEIASRDLRLRVGAAHGVSDRIQVAADAYWHPPFRMTDATQSLFEGDGTVSTTYGYSQRFQDVFGVRLDGRWRPVSLVEAFGTGTWEHQAVSYSAASASPASNYRTSTLTAGGTWLSRQPRRSETLTADVPGLYHPLVEPRQVKIDGFVYYQAYREPSAIFALDVRVYRLQVTTGIFSWLQASAYGGALLSKHYMSGGKFERSGSYGGELKLRLKAGAELYGTLEQHRAEFVGRYPMFVLASGDPLYSSFDFLNPDFEGIYTAHLGARFVF
jgi:hypothetical protein